MIPSFVSRVERPERGGEWISYLEQRRADTERWVARLGLDRRERRRTRPSVELIHVDGDEDDLLAASLYEATGLPEAEIREPDRPARPDRARGACSPTSPASAATAATAPAAAGRRSATASRSSPTTAASATCSATGC